MSSEHKRPKFLPQSGEGIQRMRTKQQELAAHEEFLRKNRGRR